MIHPLPPAIDRALAVLAAFHSPWAMPWAIAGGWAIDLALGRVTRPHGDVDVAILREDQRTLRSALAGWRFERAAAGVWIPWSADERLALPDHVALAHPPAGEPIEILLNERAGTDWVYRRDPAITRPLDRAFVVAPNGLHLLAPEIVLLYKSKAPRMADEHDFELGQSLLDDDAREWLRSSIHRASPDHSWITSL